MTGKLAEKLVDNPEEFTGYGLCILHMIVQVIENSTEITFDVADAYLAENKTIIKKFIAAVRGDAKSQTENSSSNPQKSNSSKGNSTASLMSQIRDRGGITSLKPVSDKRPGVSSQSAPQREMSFADLLGSAMQARRQAIAGANDKFKPVRVSDDEDSWACDDESHEGVDSSRVFNN